MKKLNISSASIALLDQGMVSGVNLLVTILLGRTLGLEGFGEYTFGWMMVLLASSIQQAALLTPMKSLAPQQTNIKAYFTASLYMQAGFMLALFPIMWIAASLLSLSIAFPLAAVAFLSQEYARRRAFVEGKFFGGFILDAIAYGGWLLGLAFFVFVKNELTVEVAYFLLAASFGLSAVIWFIQHSLAHTAITRTQLIEACKLHWKFGSWLTGTALLQYFAGNAFVLAAGILLGNAALGLIRAIQTMMGVLHVLLLAAEHIIPVRAAAQYSKHGLKGLTEYLQTFTKKAAVPSFILLIGVALFGDVLVGYAFDIDASESASLIPLFALSYLGTLATFPLRIALRSVAHTRPFFIAYVFSAAIGIACAEPMIAAWGIVGVPVGFIAGQIITFSCLLISWKSYQNNQQSFQFFNH